MQEKTILAKTPTPGQWIRKRLHDLGRSQKTLARDIGYDASQVNRWISGKEQVPDKALMLAGACLDGPGDVHNAISLMEIHKFAEGLPHDAQKHIGTNEEAGREVARVLAARAEETAAQLSSDENDRLIHLRDHLLTACEVLVMTNQCNEHGMDLIREENIQKHLRFPFNVMTGDVLKMMGRGRGGDPDVPEHFGRYESAGGRGHWGLTLSRRAIKFREVVRRVRPDRRQVRPFRNDRGHTRQTPASLLRYRLPSTPSAIAHSGANHRSCYAGVAGNPTFPRLAKARAFRTGDSMVLVQIPEPVPPDRQREDR